MARVLCGVLHGVVHRGGSVDIVHGTGISIFNSPGTGPVYVPSTYIYSLTYDLPPILKNEFEPCKLG